MFVIRILLNTCMAATQNYLDFWALEIYLIVEYREELRIQNWIAPVIWSIQHPIINVSCYKKQFDVMISVCCEHLNVEFCKQQIKSIFDVSVSAITNLVTVMMFFYWFWNAGIVAFYVETNGKHRFGPERFLYFRKCFSYES